MSEDLFAIVTVALVGIHILLDSSRACYFSNTHVTNFWSMVKFSGNVLKHYRINETLGIKIFMKCLLNMSSNKTSTIVDLITEVLGPVFRIDDAHPQGTMISTSSAGSDNRWHRLIIIVEDDMVYAISAGDEISICVSDPSTDLETWVKYLRYTTNG